jgi:carbon starvation protein
MTRRRSILIWSAVAVVGAVCWGVVALARDEQISAVWLLGAAVGSYAIAYRFYARFIVKKVLEIDDKRATPAERLDNDKRSPISTYWNSGTIRSALGTPPLSRPS